jgi:hypothetical protein
MTITGSSVCLMRRTGLLRNETLIAFLIHKRYIPDPEQLNQQRFKRAAQMRELLYIERHLAIFVNCFRSRAN